MVFSNKQTLVFVLTIGLTVPVVYNGCGNSPFSAKDSTVTPSLGSEGTTEAPSDIDNNIDAGTDVAPGPELGPPLPIPSPPESPPVNTPPPPVGGNGTAAFVVSGHQGSSMYSCDGGESWQGYRQATASRCGSGVDCDHTAWANPGAIGYGADGFMISYGWGNPGQVQISDNGVDWKTVHQGRTFAGVAYGNGLYFLNSRRMPLFSNDAGQSWVEGGDILSTPYNQRQAYFVPHGDGVFISVSNSSGVVDTMISVDDGATFRHPTTLPSGCGEGLLGYNDDTIVLISQNICVSTDGAENWTAIPRPTGMGSGRSQKLIFDGAEFKTYSRGIVFRSTNGITWTQTPLQLNGVVDGSLDLKHPAFHPANGRFVAFKQSSPRWYESTEYYYSDDGVNWIQLNRNSANVPIAPHPFRGIAVGYLKDCN